MSDDFDKLRAAMRQAPTPDTDAKAAAMALAMQNFDRLHQGTGVEARPNQDRPKKAGFLTGVRLMLSKLTARPILTATTSAAALCIGLIVVLPLATQRPDAVLVPQPVVVENDAIGTLSETSVAQEPVPQALEREETTPSALKTQPEAKRARVAVAPDAEAASDMVSGNIATTTSPQQSGTRMQATAPAFAAAPAPSVTDQAMLPEPNTEAFANADQNPIKVTAEQPVSTFSVDVDTASYAIIRDSLMSGYLPPPEAVRIEEMINYFPYDYGAPKPGEAPFQSSVTVMPTPWNADTRLVRIGLQGRLPVIEDRPALNLVFLIDTSGSMQNANKLPLLKQSLRLLLPQLRPEDEVAIVAYAGSAGEVLPPTKAENATAILAALDRLEAGGATSGAEGLELAYRIAEKMTAAGEVSRVLLATDGDFNVGVSDPDGLEKYVEKKRKTGTYLSVLGFGRGNLDDATMQALAQSGNGMAAYIDTLQEARKVLVDQLSGTLFPIADDVKIQVEWNPAQVAEYRLIGYETRALAREDFNNDKVDAGEIGAGHSVTAIYEVTAPNSPALANNPLRYGTDTVPKDSAELGFLRLRYKAPGESTSALIEAPIVASDDAPDEDARFATAIAGFGQLLTRAKYLGDWGWDEAIALALQGRGADEFGYRAEAINLMRFAQSLSAP
ncbi:MAG: Ca-activated chloride channel family protein [Pseudorhodobacter sp.]|jgi:Ca-activated chloride channel family protein